MKLYSVELNKKHIPVLLDPIPYLIMSNNIVKRRNEAYIAMQKACEKSLQESLEYYKKWFSIPYGWEYRYMNNNWLKRHGYPMRRRRRH